MPMKNIKIILTYYIKMIPVVPTRGGEVALGLYYKTFLIYRTCMRLAPARPVRAAFVRSCCGVVVQEHGLRTTPVMQRQANTLSTLHTALFTPRTSHFTLALHTPHFISSQIM